MYDIFKIYLRHKQILQLSFLNLSHVSGTIIQISLVSEEQFTLNCASGRWNKLRLPTQRLKLLTAFVEKALKSFSFARYPNNSSSLFK